MSITSPNTWVGYNRDLERAWVGNNITSRNFLQYQLARKSVLQVIASPEDFVENVYKGNALNFKKGWIQRLFLKHDAASCVWYAFNFVAQPRTLGKELLEFSSEWQWFCRNTLSHGTGTNFEYVAVLRKSKIAVYRQGSQNKYKIVVIYNSGNTVTKLPVNKISNLLEVLLYLPFIG